MYHLLVDMNHSKFMVDYGGKRSTIHLFLDELGREYPDDMPFLETSLRMEYFARIANPLIGGRAYRSPN